MRLTITLLSYFILIFAANSVFAQSGSPLKTAIPELAEQPQTAEEQAKDARSQAVDIGLADPEPETEPSEKAAQAASSEKPNPTKAADKTPVNNKTFRPSEEISEDQPVPFPVDI